MLKSSVKTRGLLGCLRTDKDGVVSFEYVFVAACIVGAVAAVFGGTGAGTIQGALTGGIGDIANAIVAAV